MLEEPLAAEPKVKGSRQAVGTHKSENHVEINPAECKGCGLCVAACPRDCIALGSTLNELGYQYARFVKRNCTACGFCYYVCPEPGAISVFARDKKGGKG